MKREREKEGKREGTLGSLWKKNNKKTRAVWFSEANIWADQKKEFKPLEIPKNN
jgi:hypothetical protein